MFLKQKCRELGNIRNMCDVTFSGAVGPMFLGGQGQYFSDKPKIFSDKPKIFLDNNILNLHTPPLSTTLTISDNIDNFPTTLTIFRPVSTIGGPCPPPLVTFFNKDESMTSGSFLSSYFTIHGVMYHTAFR